MQNSLYNLTNDESRKVVSTHENNTNTITTLEIAEMMEVEHKEILKKLEGTTKPDGSVKQIGIIPVLTRGNFPLSDYFTLSTYKDASGKENKCYNVTRLGCDFLANKFTGEKGILFTAKYVKRFNEMEQGINLNLQNLSPELQAVIQLTQLMARQELEQKRQAGELQAVKSTVQNMKNELLTPMGDWRSEINDKVREIAIKSGIDYQELYPRMYAELETTAHCSLSSLQRGKRDRMTKAGNTKTCIKNETTKIAIIEGKPQLKAIFESIVRRYAVAYCA